MYGKIPERKIKEQDYIMSCQKARQELDQYLNDQSKRVNIDSAKKRAVLQLMDYQGFRQMVLGANIFPTKSKQLYQFSKGEENNVSVNKLFVKEGNLQTKPQIKVNLQGNSEKHCISFSDFKKKFNKHYSKQLDEIKAQELYSLIKEQNQQRIKKIFNTDCQANILIKVIQLFEYILVYLTKNESKGLDNEVSFMAKFLQTVLQIPTMKSLSMCILTKKQKNYIIEFCERLKVLIPGENVYQIDEIIKLI